MKMPSDSEEAWETEPESMSESELQEIRKYDTSLKREREKAEKAKKQREEEEEKEEIPASPNTRDPMNGDCRHIISKIEDEPNLKLGFVIFRTTYKDQEKWDRFMHHLNERTRLNFEEENAPYLFDHVDWCVQEDPSLDRASSKKVRRRFKKWIRECGEKDHWLGGSARYMACVQIDSFALNSVLKGPPSSEFDADQFGVVNLVSVDEDEDEMLAGLSYLVPRLYVLLESCGWDNFAPRDGEVVAWP